MASAIVHRGPDGEGFFIEDAGQPSVGLANRRLAVIDLPGGAQPMSTEDGAYTIVYNGEIFNASEVRRALESAGHQFRSRCDTEVVLRGFQEWGEEVLHRLNGMWAFAVWDARRRRLFLSRDRLGVKPLVYADTPSGFAFGSEIKTLTASGLVERRLDHRALPFYLSAFAIPEPFSLVAGVRRLPAGHSVTVDGAGVRERQYWDCSMQEEEDAGRAAYLDQIGDLLEDSVRRRLVSDVPLGVLLSAGIDSNLVATLAARHSDDALRTFTLGFGNPETDEQVPARQLAEALGANHTEDEVAAGAVLGRLPHLLVAYDEPGQSLLQTDVVCELAARDVTVALSGLGGDELFSAYPAHILANMLARLDRVPGPLRQPVIGLARLLPNERIRRLAALASMRPDDRATERLMHETDAGIRSRLLAPEVRAEVDLEAPQRHLEEHLERATAVDPLNRMLYVYLKTYLPNELLRASDAMSMLHSLELRTPFLDYRLVERAMAIPARHKARRTTGKLLLRDLARDALPVEQQRGKRGFSLPVATWLRRDLREQVRETLSPQSIRDRGVFEPDSVHYLLDRCLAGDDRYAPPVMMVYCFEEWARGWLDPPEPAHAGAGNGIPADGSHAS